MPRRGAAAGEGRRAQEMRGVAATFHRGGVTTGPCGVRRSWTRRQPLGAGGTRVPTGESRVLPGGRGHGRPGLRAFRNRLRRGASAAACRPTAAPAVPNARAPWTGPPSGHLPTCEPRRDAMDELFLKAVGWAYSRRASAGRALAGDGRKGRPHSRPLAGDDRVQGRSRMTELTAVERVRGSSTGGTSFVCCCR